MADAIWNDRWILSNGAVSANAPLSGDGSNSQPLGIDPNVILPYPMEFVSTSSQATAQNVIYVVTGTNS